MTEVTPAREVPVPLIVPALLSFVAGYVDSHTYLALFGLFVAQVTSSFVIAGAELVRHSSGAAGKLLVIIAFVAAAALTAALVGMVRQHRRAALPWMLVLETVLLGVFTAMIFLGPPIRSVDDWYGVTAGLVAATAMGAQSVLVRLLMKGIPQTNVMTGNVTQLGIEITEIILAWRRSAREPGNRDLAEEFDKVRARLVIVLAVAAGFLFGAAAGAVAFATSNLRGVLVAVAVVGTLALWAVYRENSVPHA